VAGPADAASLRLASPPRTLAVQAADASRVGSAYLLLRERESGFRAALVQQAASQHAGRSEAWRRYADLVVPCLPGSSGARQQVFREVGPTLTGSFGSGGDRPLHHRGRILVDRPGARGFRPGLRLLSWSAVRLVRPVSTEALLPPSSGTSPWEHRDRTAGNSALHPDFGSGARP
jgi:hypothetical protein